MLTKGQSQVWILVRTFRAVTHSRTSIWAVGNPQGQMTQMNLRGLSYWMLPSQSVSRLGYLAKVRSQQLVPGGASISLRLLCAPPLTAEFHVWYGPDSSPVCMNAPIRSSLRLLRAPWCGAHAAAYTVSATATDKNSQTTYRNKRRGSLSPMHFLTLDMQRL